MNEDVEEALRKYKVAKLHVEVSELKRDQAASMLAEALVDVIQAPTPKRKRSKSPPQETSEANGADTSKPSVSPKTLAKYVAFEPKTEGCACGCGDETLGGQQFLRGHWKALATIATLVDDGEIDFSTIAPQGMEYVSKLETISESLRGRCREAIGGTEASA